MGVFLFPVLKSSLPSDVHKKIAPYLSKGKVFIEKHYAQKKIVFGRETTHAFWFMTH